MENGNCPVVVQRIPDYYEVGDKRNRKNAAFYTELVELAFGKCQRVLVGHHICFQTGGHIQTENEIPSADALLFDHEIMTRVYSEMAVPLMMKMASVPAEMREPMAMRELEKIKARQLPQATCIYPAGKPSPSTGWV